METGFYYLVLLLARVKGATVGRPEGVEMRGTVPFITLLALVYCTQLGMIVSSVNVTGT